MDIRVLALTWMVEKECKGGVDHLRTEPLPAQSPRRTRSKEDSSTDFYSSGPSRVAGSDSTAHDHAADGGGEGNEVSRTQELEASTEPNGTAAPPGDEEMADGAVLDSAVDISDPSGSGMSGPGMSGPACECSADAAEARREARRRAEAAEAAEAAAVAAGARQGGRAADDGPEWITVENLKDMQRRQGSRYAYAPDASTATACLTIDYAMQSVLMQMGLKLLGADGMLLKSIKQWVLRCSGCFTQQDSLERSFCSKCGNTSLVRLQAVVDSRGSQRILPEERAPARVRSTNVRGTKFPMPMPKAGRHANNMILAEDQLAEAADKARRQGKARVADVFDPDYSLDDHFGRSGKKSGGGNGMPKVGYGKRANPNDVRSRPKRT